MEAVMKPMRKILMLMALAGIFGTGLVGCGKSSDSNSQVSGNVNINGGNIATATDVVSGVSVTLTMMTTPGGYNPFGSAATVTLNGVPLNLQPSLPQNYYNVGPTYLTLGQYYAAATAICPDPSCTNMAIVVWVQPAGFNGANNGIFNPAQPAMQMGIYKDQAGIIHSSIERVGYATTIYGVSGSPALPTATDTMTWLMQNAH
jgi:hypothetical protein